MAQTLVAPLMALALVTAPGQLPPPQIELSARAEGAADVTPVGQRFDIPAKSLVVYVSTANTACSAVTVATAKPVGAGSGWRVEIKPAEVAGTAIGVPIVVSWRRLWLGGRELPEGKSDTTTLFMMPTTAIVLDTLEGDLARLTAEVTARLTAWRPGMPPPPEILADVFLQSLESTIARKREQKMALIRQNGYGESHPAVAAINDEIAVMAAPLNSRIETLIRDYLDKLPTTLPTLLGGCTATGLSLQIKTAPR